MNRNKACGGRTLRAVVAVTVLVLLLASGAGAATLTVDAGGGADYTRIQDAVNAASYGDTIYVYDGTYYESLKVYKPLILIGKNKNTTIVDAGGGKKGIEITADDVVINGFTLRNSIDAGIKLSSSSNGSTITNNTIHSIIGSSDSDGIEVTISSHNVISNNEIFDCDDEGIEIDGSSYNIVTNNTIHSITDNAIDLRGSLYNYIANNTIYSNGDDGISLGRSWGVEPVIWGSSHNTITFNDIYLNDGDGIKLKNSSNNNITNNNISLNSDDGIGINELSSNNFVTDNNVFSNSDNGIDMEDSSNNNITKNIIYLNGADGIDLEGYSSYNSITNNKIFDDGTEGIDINDYSSHNSITNNAIFNNSNDGIHIENIASNNMIIDNSFSSNGNAGVRIELSNNNQIYHNNFINNAKQADDDGNNFWDNGYPSGGNYWSDYTGSDSNGDSLGDIPYNIIGSAGAQDRYPLMNPWETTPTAGGTVVSIPNVTATPSSNITLSIIVENVNNLAAGTIWLTYDPNVVHVLSVSQGDLSSVTASIDNTTGKTTMSVFTTTPGSGNVTFANVQLKAVGSVNSTSQLTLSVSSLNDQNGAAIPYTIKNGTFTISSVIKGDVNSDSSVTIVDALFVAQYTVGLRTLNSQQLAAADVNNDGQVNIVDALFIAQYTVGLRQL